MKPCNAGNCVAECLRILSPDDVTFSGRCSPRMVCWSFDSCYFILYFILFPPVFFIFHCILSGTLSQPFNVFFPHQKFFPLCPSVNSVNLRSRFSRRPSSPRPVGPRFSWAARRTPLSSLPPAAPGTALRPGLGALHDEGCCSIREFVPPTELLLQHTSTEWAPKIQFFFSCFDARCSLQ